MMHGPLTCRHLEGPSPHTSEPRAPTDSCSRMAAWTPGPILMMNSRPLAPGPMGGVNSVWNAHLLEACARRRARPVLRVEAPLAGRSSKTSATWRQVERRVAGPRVTKVTSVSCRARPPALPLSAFLPLIRMWRLAPSPYPSITAPTVSRSGHRKMELPPRIWLMYTREIRPFWESGGSGAEVRL